MRIRVVLVLLSLLCQGLGTEARPLRDNEIPPSLAPWVPWVLYDERDRECPFIHNQPAARRCAWPSRLVLKIDQGEGEFIQFWRVYRESWIGLPGDLERWPQEVQVDGQPASVAEREGKPGVSLPPGRYQITGGWRWERLPESLYVPPDTALVSLIVNETAVSWPDIRPDGQLWLKQQTGKTALEERLEIQVFRRIIDEVPFELLTRLEIDVAGEPREVMLNNALLPKLIPLSLSSALPARLEPDGRLRLQLRPGNWAVELSARARRGEHAAGDLCLRSLAADGDLGIRCPQPPAAGGDPRCDGDRSAPDQCAPGLAVFSRLPRGSEGCHGIQAGAPGRSRSGPRPLGSRAEPVARHGGERVYRPRSRERCDDARLATRGRGPITPRTGRDRRCPAIHYHPPGLQPARRRSPARRVESRRRQPLRGRCGSLPRGGLEPGCPVAPSDSPPSPGMAVVRGRGQRRCDRELGRTLDAAGSLSWS